MEYVTLNNGVKMPMQGYGVYRIGMSETKEKVSQALAAGYRLIDTAAAYGNEEGVGEAIRSSGISRDEIFLTTKVWSSENGEERAYQAALASMERLGVDYLDLLLIHEPMGDYYGSWRAFQRLYREGKTRAIGICNIWPDKMLDLILNADIKPQVLQIETHPFNQQRAYHELLTEYHVVHEAWGTLAEGRERIFDNKTLTEIADKHHKSVSQVIHRWDFERGIVTLTTTSKPERMKENQDIFDFALTKEDHRKISLLDRDRPLILNNRDLETVARLAPRHM